MPNNVTTGSNGAKAFAGVITVVAVIAGLFAMVRPMGQRIDALGSQVESLREELHMHNASEGHPLVLQKHAEASERFKEVETQFRGMRELVSMEQSHTSRRLGVLEAWMSEHDRVIAATDATQWEKIRALERATYRGD